jgi:hypothetical protein
MDIEMREIQPAAEEAATEVYSQLTARNQSQDCVLRARERWRCALQAVVVRFEKLESHDGRLSEPYEDMLRG